MLSFFDPDFYMQFWASTKPTVTQLRANRHDISNTSLSRLVFVISYSRYSRFPCMCSKYSRFFRLLVLGLAAQGRVHFFS